MSINLLYIKTALPFFIQHFIKVFVLTPLLLRISFNFTSTPKNDFVYTVFVILHSSKTLAMSSLS